MRCVFILALLVSGCATQAQRDARQAVATVNSPEVQAQIAQGIAAGKAVLAKKGTP